MSTDTPKIRRILVAHDFGETAERALECALDLAAPLGAHVTVMHAYEIPVLSVPDGPVLSVGLIEEIERAASVALDKVLAHAQRPGVEVDSSLRQGVAWMEIAAAAKEMKADLVVVGTHGRRGVSRALLGSVAEKVVRTAPCPVMTVREPNLK
jgi:nucleotide-binding universal stress UspA family protein